ncbi:MAG: hypothetical protein P1U40_10350 [Coxiellaceae bacterium]|nr:hypothetical protein [Coxiellaceae bacterium]
MKLGETLCDWLVKTPDLLTVKGEHVKFIGGAMAQEISQAATEKNIEQVKAKLQQFKRYLEAAKTSDDADNIQKLIDLFDKDIELETDALAPDELQQLKDAGIVIAPPSDCLYFEMSLEETEAMLASPSPRSPLLFQSFFVREIKVNVNAVEHLRFCLLDAGFEEKSDDTHATLFGHGYSSMNTHEVMYNRLWAFIESEACPDKEYWQAITDDYSKSDQFDFLANKLSTVDPAKVTADVDAGKTVSMIPGYADKTSGHVYSLNIVKLNGRAYAFIGNRGDRIPREHTVAVYTITRPDQLSNPTFYKTLEDNIQNRDFMLDMTSESHTTLGSLLGFELFDALPSDQWSDQKVGLCALAASYMQVRTRLWINDIKQQCDNASVPIVEGEGITKGMLRQSLQDTRDQYKSFRYFCRNISVQDIIKDLIHAEKPSIDVKSCYRVFTDFFNNFVAKYRDKTAPEAVITNALQPLHDVIVADSDKLQARSLAAGVKPDEFDTQLVAMKQLCRSAMPAVKFTAELPERIVGVWV